MNKFLLSLAIGLISLSSAFGQYQAGGGNATGLNSVAIMIGSDAPTSRSVAIGQDASAALNNTYNSNAPNGGVVAIGWDAQGHSWRTVSVGERTIAAATSSTAVGANANAMKSHDVAYGRGAWTPQASLISSLQMYDSPNSVLGASSTLNENHIYFNNSWAHRFPTPPSGVGVGPYTASENRTNVLHGVDAQDASVPVSQGPSFKGGHLQLAAGKGTGQEDGGRLEFATSPGRETLPNRKNDRCVAAYFDSSKTADTRFVILDLRTNEYRRIDIGRVLFCNGEEKDVLCLGDIETEIDKPAGQGNAPTSSP